MKLFFYTLSIFLFQTSFGQSAKKIDIPVHINSNNQKDTSIWFKDYFKLGQTLRLPNLIENKDTFYFRFWSIYLAIDIWTYNSENIFGTVTYFRERYNEKLLSSNQYIVDSVFYKTTKLDTAISKNIFIAIKNLELEKIPSDENISGWNQGFDGVEYMIEMSTRSNYYFKTYWSPKSFSETLNEAKKIQLFIDYLFKDIDIWSIAKKPKIPKGTFKTFGIPAIEVQSTHNLIEGARPLIDIF